MVYSIMIDKKNDNFEQIKWNKKIVIKYDVEYNDEYNNDDHFDDENVKITIEDFLNKLDDHIGGKMMYEIQSSRLYSDDTSIDKIRYFIDIYIESNINEYSIIYEVIHVNLHVSLDNIKINNI